MASPRTRQLSDTALFLGPAIVLLLIFFLAPIVVNLMVAFSDMSQTVRLDGFPTAEQFNKLGRFSDEAWLGVELRSFVLSRAYADRDLRLLYALSSSTSPSR